MSDDCERNGGQLKSYCSLSSGCLLIGMIFLLCPNWLLAQNRAGSGDDVKTGGSALTESLDEIDNNLRDVRESRDEVFFYQPFQKTLIRWGEFWQTVNEKSGLSMGFAHTSLYQVATKGSYDGAGDGGSGSLDVFGRLNLMQSDVQRGLLNKGVIGFAANYQHQIGAISPADLGDSLGSLWGTASGFGVRDFSFVEWWWQQYMWDERLAFRVGKIDLSGIFDVYRFNSSDHFFVNAAFSDNPTIPFPSNGLGTVLRWNLGHDLFVIAGWGEAEGRKTETVETSTNPSDAWFSASTLGWNPEIKGLGRGLYQLTLWHTNQRSGSTKPSATGYSVIIQQEVGNGWTPFARVAYSDDVVVDTKNIVTGGVVREGMGSREHDRFGMAVAWGEPHDSSYREQWTAELFYRWAATPEFRITPLAQIIVNPSKNPNDRLIGLFGLRARLTF